MLAQLYKLWKHHAAYLKEIPNRKDDYTPSKHTNNTKLKVEQAVMVRNHVHLDFEPEYLMDYRVLE